MAELPPNHPYFHNHAPRNSHFSKASFIASLRDDYYKLSIKHQNLLCSSLAEYKAIKNTLNLFDRKSYKQHHNILNHLILESIQMAKELDESLKDHLSPYSFG